MAKTTIVRYSILKSSLGLSLFLCNTCNKIEKDEPEALMNSKRCLTIFHKKYVNHPSIRSFYYPHMHAINCGEWTFNKYPCLKALVESYGIDTSLRKPNTWWHLHEE